MSKILTKPFYLFLILMIIAEILSFLGHFWSPIESFIFAAICLTTVYLSWKDVKYGLFLIFAELFIGSFGYLFTYSINEHVISIRMALWLIVLMLWAIKTMRKFLSNDLAEQKKYWRQIIIFPYSRYFYALFACLALGLIMSYFYGNQALHIFFDFNNWLYLLLIFPLADSFKTRQDFEDLGRVLAAAVIWLSLKTLLVAYIFAHNFNQAPLYQWLRDSRLGEITPTAAGFFRIFFQSHIFIVLAAVSLLPMAVKALADKQKSFKIFWSLSLCLAVVVISLSRSFWLGLLAAGAAAVIYYWQKVLTWRVWLKTAVWLLLACAAAAIIITTVLKFPWPEPKSAASAWQLLNERGNLNESAVASRWSQLPVLWSAIGQSPIFGQGFGKTLIYQSSDPRILAARPDGWYETYAFEWAWLDLWLKIGLVGILTYLLLLITMMRNAWQTGQIDLALSLIALLIINVFTPYLNHPLGLGAIMLISVKINIFKKNHHGSFNLDSEVKI